MFARCGVSALCSLAAVASLPAWLACAAVHINGGGSCSSRASQRCTMRFMRARSLRCARGYSSSQQYSALARPFHAQATTVSAVCQPGLALFRGCGLTIRSSGRLRRAPLLSRDMRQPPLNSSVRPHIRFLFNARSLRHIGFCSLAAAAPLLAGLACAAPHFRR